MEGPVGTPPRQVHFIGSAIIVRQSSKLDSPERNRRLDSNQTRPTIEPCSPSLFRPSLLWRSCFAYCMSGLRHCMYPWHDALLHTDSSITASLIRQWRIRRRGRGQDGCGQVRGELRRLCRCLRRLVPRARADVCIAAECTGMVCRWYVELRDRVVHHLAVEISLVACRAHALLGRS